jgi:hypothetical protein
VEGGFTVPLKGIGGLVLASFEVTVGAETSDVFPVGTSGFFSVGRSGLSVVELGDAGIGGGAFGVATGGGASFDGAGVFELVGFSVGFDPGVIGGGLAEYDLAGVVGGASFASGGGPGGGGGLVGGALLALRLSGGFGVAPIGGGAEGDFP